MGQTALRYQIHDRQQEQRLVGSAVAGKVRPAGAGFVGAKAGELLGVSVHGGWAGPSLVGSLGPAIIFCTRAGP